MNLLQFYYVWMSKKFEVLNFSANFSYYIKTFNLLPIHYFDGYFVASQLVNANYLLKHMNIILTKQSNVEIFLQAQF